MFIIKYIYKELGTINIFTCLSKICIEIYNNKYFIKNKITIFNSETEKFLIVA